MRSFLVCTALLATVLATAGDAAAQASRTDGFLLGARLNGAAFTPEDEDTESGGGIGFILGYGFNSAIALYLNVDGTALEVDGDDYTLGFADLGLRYTFGTSAAALRPYVNAALTGAAIQTEFDNTTVELRGGGLTAGGGVNYFFSRRVALDAALQLTFGRFTEGRAEGVTVPLEEDEFNFRSSRVQLGVNFRP